MLQDVSLIVPTGYPGGHRHLCDKTAVLSDIRKTPCIKVDQSKCYLYKLKLWVGTVKFSLQISAVFIFCCNTFHFLFITLTFLPSGFKRKY